MQNINKTLFTIIGWHPRGYGFSRPPVRDWPLDFLSRDADDAAAFMEVTCFNLFANYKKALSS